VETPAGKDRTDLVAPFIAHERGVSIMDQMAQVRDVAARIYIPFTNEEDFHYFAAHPENCPAGVGRIPDVEDRTYATAREYPGHAHRACWISATKEPDGQSYRFPTADQLDASLDWQVVLSLTIPDPARGRFFTYHRSIEELRAIATVWTVPRVVGSARVSAYPYLYDSTVQGFSTYSVRLPRATDPAAVVDRIRETRPNLVAAGVEISDQSGPTLALHAHFSLPLLQRHMDLSFKTDMLQFKLVSRDPPPTPPRTAASRLPDSPAAAAPMVVPRSPVVRGRNRYY